MVWFLVAGAGSVWAAGVGVTPIVFWASDPVRPGEAVLVTGDGLTADCAVELFRLADEPAGQPQAIRWPDMAVKPEVLQPRGQSLKFVLPADLGPGVVAFRVRSGEAVSATRLLNVPDPWWCQGDAGTAATPGGTVRLLGKNLSWSHSASGAPDGAGPPPGGREPQNLRRDVMKTKEIVKEFLALPEQDRMEVLRRILPPFAVSRASVGSVDFKAPAPERFRLRLAAYLANEPHVLKLVARGDGAVTVDAFEVFEPPVK